jgi:hypothetical protein
MIIRIFILLVCFFGAHNLFAQAPAIEAPVEKKEGVTEQKLPSTTSKPIDFNNIDFSEPAPEKDVFFPKYINHDLIYNYQFRLIDDKKIEELTQLTVKITPITIPNLKLKSILYQNENSWTVWLNGKKITYFNKDTIPDFSIFSVSKDVVQIVMFYPDLKYFENYLKNKLLPYKNTTPSQDFMSEEEEKMQWDFSNENETILVNKTEGIILVTLENSQEFESNNFIIKESFYPLEEPNVIQPEVTEKVVEPVSKPITQTPAPSTTTLANPTTNENNAPAPITIPPADFSDTISPEEIPLQ